MLQPEASGKVLLHQPAQCSCHPWGINEDVIWFVVLYSGQRRRTWCGISVLCLSLCVSFLRKPIEVLLLPLLFSSHPDSVLRAASSVNDDHPTCSTGRRIQYHIVRLLLSYLVHIPPASIHDLPIRLISSFRDFRDSAWPLNLNVLNLAKVDGTARSSVYNTTQHTYCCLEEEFFQSKRYTNRYKI